MNENSTQYLTENLSNILKDEDKINKLDYIIKRHDQLSILYKSSEKFFQKKQITTLLMEYRYALRSFVDIFKNDEAKTDHNNPKIAVDAYIRSMQSLDHIYCDLIDIFEVFALEEYSQLKERYGLDLLYSHNQGTEIFVEKLEKMGELISPTRANRKERTEEYVEKITPLFEECKKQYDILFSDKVLLKFEKIDMDKRKRRYIRDILMLFIGSIVSFLIPILFSFVSKLF